MQSTTMQWPGPEFDDVDIDDDAISPDAGGLPFHHKPEPKRKPKEPKAEQGKD